MRSSLFDNGMSIFQTNGKSYCIDFHNRSIICMEDYGFDTQRLKPGANSHTKLPTERQTDIHINKDIINPLPAYLDTKPVPKIVTENGRLVEIVVMMIWMMKGRC